MQHLFRQIQQQQPYPLTEWGATRLTGHDRFNPFATQKVLQPGEVGTLTGSVDTFERDELACLHCSDYEWAGKSSSGNEFNTCIGADVARLCFYYGVMIV